MYVRTCGYVRLIIMTMQIYNSDVTHPCDRHDKNIRPIFLFDNEISVSRGLTSNQPTFSTCAVRAVCKSEGVACCSARTYVVNKANMASSTLLTALLVLCALTAHGYCKRPNIIFLLTDDQDLTLGGMTPLVFTKALMESGGATLNNFFVNTPVCCPSRTTLLTGIYTHNWHVTSGPACMHMGVTNSHFEQSTIGVQLKKLNYTTGMFGKLLNPSGMAPYCKKDSAGKYQPLPGFDDYTAMCNDNRYYKNIFTKNGEIFQSGTEPKDYLTSIIGNDTIEFMERALSTGEPFFAYVAPHAPHVPSTPAPWYAERFAGLSAPRTPSYNYSAVDHHYVIRSQQPLTTKIAGEVDELFRNRWRSLLSVDDIMINVVDLLKKHNALSDTYIIATSDHGFNLGQLRLPSCKLQPYDHDIRVPFHMYGPKIPAGSSFDFVAGMVDVSPTLLSLAEGSPLDTMDGKSFANLVTGGNKEEQEARDMHMIEYWSLGNVIRYEHYIDMPNNTYIGARLINSTHNYLYAEFYDGENVVSFDTPLEYELFDLSKDPYQLTNLYQHGDTTSQAVMKQLKSFIHSQVQCKGKTCQ